MKKTESILGLPAIDLSSGNQIGKIWDIIINGDTGAIDYFIVDDGMMILGAKVVESNDVQGIGEYALTVADKEVLNDISKIQRAVELFKQNVKVKGTKVLTQKGRLVGQIGDIYIDERTCLISALEFVAFDAQDKVRIIPRDKVLTYGEKLIVVVENLEEVLRDTPGSGEDYFGVSLEPKMIEENTTGNTPEHEEKDMLYVDERKKELPHTNRVDEEAKQGEQVEDAGSNQDPMEDEDIVEPGQNEKVYEEQQPQQQIVQEEEIALPEVDGQTNGILQESEPVGEVGSEAAENESEVKQAVVNSFKEGISAPAFTYKQGYPPKIESKNKQHNKHNNPKSSNLFEEKQKEFLIGRKVTRTVKDRTGNVLLSQGEVITEEAINNAKNAGKLIEIVMNNKP